MEELRIILFKINVERGGKKFKKKHSPMHAHQTTHPQTTIGKDVRTPGGAYPSRGHLSVGQSKGGRVRKE